MWSWSNANVQEKNDILVRDVTCAPEPMDVFLQLQLLPVDAYGIEAWLQLYFLSALVGLKHM